MRPYLHQQIRAFSNKLVSLIPESDKILKTRISETTTVFRHVLDRVSLIRKFADSLPYDFFRNSNLSSATHDEKSQLDDHRHFPGLTRKNLFRIKDINYFKISENSGQGLKIPRPLTEPIS